MSRFTTWMLGSAVLVLGCGFASNTAGAAVIADWRFGSAGGGFLDDSSGNGYHLEAASGSVAQGSDGTYSSFAQFNGSSHLRTVSVLDLDPYSKIRVRWTMQSLGTNSGIVLESSPNQNSFTGAIVISAHDMSPTTGAAGPRFTGSYNTDSYTHFSGPVWHSYAVEINLTSLNAADVVRTFVDGVLQPDAVAFGLHDMPDISFFSDQKVFVGARDNSGSPVFFFNGNLVDVRIETIEPLPEPSGVLVAVLGSLAALSIRRRGRV